MISVLLVAFLKNAGKINAYAALTFIEGERSRVKPAPNNIG
jgi:hypothetical protein